MVINVARKSLIGNESQTRNVPLKRDKDFLQWGPESRPKVLSGQNIPHFTVGQKQVDFGINTKTCFAQVLNP